MEPGSFVPGVAWVAPFAALLLGIALLPLAAPHFWESNLRKLVLSALLGLPVLCLYLRHHPEALAHVAADYVSFIILLGSLFVISGGVMLEGDLPARPSVNTAFLAVGSLLASFIGTTGASMLLIRPLLQTNRERKHVRHTVVFFIFLVSNIGGCLTPLGDPPLFLGYLQGVPFTWTFRLFPAWLATTTFLLSSTSSGTPAPTLARHGRTWCGIASRCGRCAWPARRTWCCWAASWLAAAFLGTPWREAAMVLLAFAPERTDPELRRANHFSFHPILEVAALFAGIFLTMLPGPRPAARAGGGPRRARALAVLLGDGRALVVPRQRPHLPDVPGPGPGPRPRRPRWWG